MVGEEDRLTVKGAFVDEENAPVLLQRPVEVVKMGIKWLLVELDGAEAYIKPTEPFETKFYLPKAA